MIDIHTRACMEARVFGGFASHYTGLLKIRFIKKLLLTPFVQCYPNIGGKRISIYLLMLFIIQIFELAIHSSGDQFQGD